MTGRVQVEICVGDLASAIAAESGGADRIELCDNLPVGGTTPSAGTIAESCRRLSIPVHVLIRPARVTSSIPNPRSPRCATTSMLPSRSAPPELFSALTPKAAVDRELTAELVALARPLSVTFHRALDQIPEPFGALDLLITLGVDRVLTTGGKMTALEGIETLTHLVRHADEKIAIMAGGQLCTSNLETVIRQSRVKEVHLGSAASRTIASSMSSQPGDGSETSWNQTDSQRVAAIMGLVRGLQVGSDN